MSDELTPGDANLLDTTPMNNPKVAAVFAAYSEPIRTELLALRRLIFNTAEEVEGVGALEETLKWGQPSYLTTETKSGSTIRIAPTGPKSDHDYALYFICHTNLVRTFRQLFSDTLTYEGGRALLFTSGRTLPENEVRECVAMALTYHTSKS